MASETTPLLQLEAQTQPIDERDSIEKDNTNHTHEENENQTR